MCRDERYIRQLNNLAELSIMCAEIKKDLRRGVVYKLIKNFMLILPVATVIVQRIFTSLIM